MLINQLTKGEKITFTGGYELHKFILICRIDFNIILIPSEQEFNELIQGKKCIECTGKNQLKISQLNADLFSILLKGFDFL